MRIHPEVQQVSPLQSTPLASPLCLPPLPPSLFPARVGLPCPAPDLGKGTKNQLVTGVSGQTTLGGANNSGKRVGPGRGERPPCLNAPSLPLAQMPSALTQEHSLPLEAPLSAE